MTLQDAFFTGFGDQIQKLGTTYLPVFQQVMGQMARSANRALVGVSTMLQTPAMQADIKTFGANAASAFDTLSGALQPVVHAFTDIATVGSSFLPQLAGTVSDLATKFGAFITSARDSGKLASWIQGGITAFGHLADIAHNLGTSLMGIFRSADGGGKDFLTTVDDLTTKLTNWINSTTGQTQLKDFFADARAELEQWKPILDNLIHALPGIFDGAKNSMDEWLPLLREASQLLRDHPALAEAIPAAYAGWTSIKGVADLFSTLKNISTLLRLTLPADAAVAGGGLAKNLTGGLAAQGFRLLASGWTLPIAVAVAIAYSITKGDTTNQPDPGAPGQPQQPGLFNPPNPKGQQAFALPGQVRDANQNFDPDYTKYQAGQTVPSGTTGAVPKPGTNEWMIPYLNPDPNSTKGRYSTTPPPPSGSSDPDAGKNLGPPANPPPAPVAPQIPPVSTYTPPSDAGGGAPSPSSPGDTGGKKVAPSGFDWDAVMAHEGGTWDNADTGHSGHYGGLQFSQDTWKAFGGLEFASRADYASAEDQKTVADRTAFYGYKGTPPQGLSAWEAITKGQVPGITTSTQPLRPTPEYGSAITPKSSSGSGGGSTEMVPQAPTTMPGASVTYSPAEMQSLGIPALYQNPSGGGNPEIPDWVQTFVREHGGPSLVAMSSPHPGPSGAPGLHGAAGGPGWAIDVMGSNEDMDRLAAYLVANPSESAQLIHQSQTTGKKYGVAGGKNVSNTDYYRDSMSSEGNMVHWAPSGPPTAVSGGDIRDTNTPVPVREVNPQNLSGEDLGKNIVTGMLDIFGFGDIFKDPTSFGLAKIFKSVMGDIKPGKKKSDDDTGSDTGSSTGSGDPLVDAMSSLIPGASGNSISDDLANWMSPGGNSTGGIGSNFFADMPKQGQGGNTDNSTKVQITNQNAPADSKFVMDVLDTQLGNSTRVRNLPK